MLTIAQFNAEISTCFKTREAAEDMIERIGGEPGEYRVAQRLSHFVITVYSTDPADGPDFLLGTL